ncbi:ABC transporter substrate-binding protein [Streptacidiphilus sp. EB103A]|uniref:ABC transporter substrate-binding protein n=1 Tax=Streptacidiphilus sp. EB103A TaxID=3156275 RepID=UPI003512C668
MPHDHAARSAVRAAAAAAAAASLLLVSSACAGSSGPSSAASYTSDSTATLTVLTDDTRQPAVEQYAATHPAVKVKIVLEDSTSTVAQKIALDDKAGSGWPDVVFTGQPSDVASLAAAPLNFAEPLGDLVPASTRAQYADGTLANCTYGGKVFCLPNDVAPTVLWVNTKLMKQFGYTVPTTWAAYQALGRRLAAEHPGYLIGGVNDRDGYGVFFASSGCENRQVTDPTHVKINLSTENCTRVAKLLQPLVANGSVTTASPWDTSFVANYGSKDKLLMYPAAAWFGEYAFKGTYKIPNGELAAYTMPTWPGSSTQVAGAEGGGLWMVSSHSKNMKGAADMVSWLTQSTDAKGIVASSTLPAYTPAAKVWCAARASDAFYSADPCPAEVKEAGLISPTFNYIRFEAQFDDSYAQTFIKAANAKSDLTASLTTWQSDLDQAASNAGYQVQQ